MLIGNVDNRNVKNTEVPEEVKNFFEKRNKKLIACSSFKDLAESYESKEEFVGNYRVAASLKLLFKGVEFGRKRDAKIYLGNSSDIKVNLGTIGAVIEARVFLPGGDYGLFGKIDTLRNKTKEYYKEKVKIVIDETQYAYEENLETGEIAYMNKGTIEIFSKKLLDKILEDKNVVILLPKI